MLCVGSHHAEDGCVALLCPSSSEGWLWSSSFCQGRAQPGAGAKKCCNNICIPSRWGCVLWEDPIQPCSTLRLLPPQPRASTTAWGTWGKGMRGLGGYWGRDLSSSSSRPPHPFISTHSPTSSVFAQLRMFRALSVFALLPLFVLVAL